MEPTPHCSSSEKTYLRAELPACRPSLAHHDREREVLWVPTCGNVMKARLQEIRKRRRDDQRNGNYEKTCLRRQGTTTHYGKYF